MTTDTEILEEIVNSLEGLKFGSLEIIVQDGEVTQISTRIIKKTSPRVKTNGNKRYNNLIV